MTNARRKGANGEREAAAAWLQATGLLSHRGCQHRGGPDSPDIVTVPGQVHVEVKRRRRIAAMDYLRQAEHDAPGGAIPVTLYREDGDTRWVLAVRLDRLVDLAEELVRARAETVL